MNAAKRPTYDLVFIISFGFIGLLCVWSVFWNYSTWGPQVSTWGVGLVGIISLVGVIIYTYGVRQLRKNFVWEILKNR